MAASRHGPHHPARWPDPGPGCSTRIARRRRAGSSGSCRRRRGDGNRPSTGGRRPGSCRSGDSATCPRPRSVAAPTTGGAGITRAWDACPCETLDQPGCSDLSGAGLRWIGDREPHLGTRSTSAPAAGSWSWTSQLPSLLGAAGVTAPSTMPASSIWRRAWSRSTHR